MATVNFYFDEMMSRTAAKQLVERGYIVVMAVDVDMIEEPDSEHLQYATQHGLVLVTFDRPFAGRTAMNTNHNGLICLSGSQDDVGKMVRTLAEFAELHEDDDTSGIVFWL